MASAHHDDALHRNKCNSIYANLLAVRGTDLPATAYIREFDETSRCDSVFDMAPQRLELTSKLNNDDSKRMDRVRSFDETEKDDSVAAQAVLHYRTWHEERLLSAVSWPTWFHYHTIVRAEHAFATLGIAGSGFAGFKAAQASFRHLQALRIARRAAAAVKSEADAGCKRL